MIRQSSINRFNAQRCTTTAAPGRLGRAGRATMYATAFACLYVIGAIQSDAGTLDVIETRAAIEKWVEVRRIISLEKRDWALSKELLTSRIALVEDEINELRNKIAKAEETVTETDREREELIKENENLKEAAAALAEVVSGLESRTQALLTRLPDPIRDRVKPLSQRLPKDLNETELSLSERFQNVIGILNEVNKFNREITAISEVRTVPGGTSVEVTTIYVGISHAYYVGANGTVAGVGTASTEGWTWTPRNDAAPQIAQAIAILKNEQVASFVKLPVEIK